jgi:hypothetical protein
MNKYLKCFACLLLITGFIGTHYTYGQDKDIPKELYAAAGIPDSLKEDANSVIRYSNDEITIKGPGQATVKHHQIVTILNEKGDREAALVMFYNRKYDTYSDIVMRVYDADGVLFKKYHKSDMYDGLAINNEDMMTDEHVLGVRHVVSSYPTTIEVEYEEDLSSFISLDDWKIQALEQSVQNETYKVLARPEIGFRYDDKNISLKPDKASENGYDTYTWHLKNIRAIKQEDEVLPWTILPCISFGTNKFNCYGFPGDIDSWQNLGKWIYNLNSDVCTLTPERIAEVQKMTDTIKTDKAKARFLYEYLQQNTRYVSIQLGIGGYKPFAASFVDDKKYGDCKALANYMYALLKAVNIPSYWAVVRAGTNEPPADPAFPNSQFNHEILCIPFKNDTTWIDCTSTTQPFGKLGSFTENRNALLITPEGGKLINTPKSTIEDNQFNSEVYLQLDSDGGAKAHVKILATGGYREMFIQEIEPLKVDDQKQQLMDYLKLKQPSVFDYKLSGNTGSVKELDIDLEYDRFCDISAGDKLFYHPHVFDLWGATIPILDKRRSDYYFEHPMHKTCITTIDLPAGYVVETLPPDQSLKFTYGNYEVKYVYNAIKNQVIATAKFNLTNQVIPAAKYTEMQEYMDAIAKAQNKKLVIHKKAA